MLKKEDSGLISQGRIEFHFIHLVLRFVTITIRDSLGLGNSKKQEKQKRLGLDLIDRISHIQFMNRARTRLGIRKAVA
jgi:hypothetical protein